MVYDVDGELIDSQYQEDVYALVPRWSVETGSPVDMAARAAGLIGVVTTEEEWQDPYAVREVCTRGDISNGDGDIVSSGNTIEEMADAVAISEKNTALLRDESGEYCGWLCGSHTDDDGPDYETHMVKFVFRVKKGASK